MCHNLHVKPLLDIWKMQKENFTSRRKNYQSRFWAREFRHQSRLVTLRCSARSSLWLDKKKRKPYGWFNFTGNDTWGPFLEAPGNYRAR